MICSDFFNSIPKSIYELFQLSHRNMTEVCSSTTLDFAIVSFCMSCRHAILCLFNGWASDRLPLGLHTLKMFSTSLAVCSQVPRGELYCFPSWDKVTSWLLGPMFDVRWVLRFPPGTRFRMWNLVLLCFSHVLKAGIESRHLCLIYETFVLFRIRGHLDDQLKTADEKRG
jgi:hypothetical protein